MTDLLPEGEQDRKDCVASRRKSSVPAVRSFLHLLFFYCYATS